MHNRRDHDESIIDPVLHPLKTLTPAQFMALGGNAVAFVRSIKGSDLSNLISRDLFEDNDDYHLVMSADGTPLMVADTSDALADWLGEQNFGLVSLH
jgi:hypothetical protein